MIGCDSAGRSVRPRRLTVRYVWEGGIYDYSLHSTVSVSFPRRPLLDLLAPGAKIRDGATYAPDGTVIAFSPGVHQANDAVDLFVRADLLHTALRASDLALLRVVFQERRGGADMHASGKFAGIRTRTSLHVHRGRAIPVGQHGMRTRSFSVLKTQTR
jgi:hypothetical protein